MALEMISWRAADDKGPKLGRSAEGTRTSWVMPTLGSWLSTAGSAG